MEVYHQTVSTFSFIAPMDGTKRIYFGWMQKSSLTSKRKSDKEMFVSISKHERLPTIH
ncbi:hypothetical protein [Maribacter hydrothermalis]|uniref:hypothetical protein n=1 Tax=Maribacter hydrothermalis TaxID=1836467 RepID=UPI0012F9F115|nr:hypothetical protein [Maribacter hydrothermalis]